jgi:hypothetical protein
MQWPSRRLVVALGLGVVTNVVVTAVCVWQVDPGIGYRFRASAYGVSTRLERCAVRWSAEAICSSGWVLVHVTYRLTEREGSFEGDYEWNTDIPDSPTRYPLYAAVRSLGLHHAPMVFDPADPHQASVAAMGAGWPCLSLRCTMKTRSFPDERWNDRSGLAAPGMRRNPLTLWPFVRDRKPVDEEDERQYRPVVLGTALNSLLYGGVFAVPLWCVPMLRRHIRAKRHCCVQCGYQLEIADGRARTCPECGFIRA